MEPGDIRFEARADPVIVEPTDAVVRTVAACVCGSDLGGTEGSRGHRKRRRSGTSTRGWSSGG